MFLAMAVVYVLLPFDLLPEVVFGVLGTYEYNFEYINWNNDQSKFPKVVTAIWVIISFLFRSPRWHISIRPNPNIRCCSI